MQMYPGYFHCALGRTSEQPMQTGRKSVTTGDPAGTPVSQCPHDCTEWDLVAPAAVPSLGPLQRYDKPKNLWPALEARSTWYQSSSCFLRWETLNIPGARPCSARTLFQVSCETEDSLNKDSQWLSATHTALSCVAGKAD